MNYRNPILPGCYPDPGICHVRPDFYLAASSFHYFPAIPVFHNRNLVDWTQIGHCLKRPDQVFPGNTDNALGIYAPTIRYHSGRFYVISTNAVPGKNYYVFTDDIFRQLVRSCLDKRRGD